jgi:23S rRNA pseudouridine955/2504/2580 synthase
VVGINKGKANVKIEILTGKRNQIRMSFAEIGCPIVGDIKFGGKKNHRLLLNACELDLRKYLDKDEYLFKSKQSVFE